jgi:hypothetical protein
MDEGRQHLAVRRCDLWRDGIVQFTIGRAYADRAQRLGRVLITEAARRYVAHRGLKSEISPIPGTGTQDGAVPRAHETARDRGVRLRRELV